MSKPSTSIPAFRALLHPNARILALCGAGLSASSGLDTFRGAGGLWRNHDAKSLATPEAFERDPGLVWLFYAERRRRALVAEPNAGHLALVEAAGRMKSFVTLTQNVDGLHQRANHPREQLKLLHGSLFDIKCFDCPYIEHNNFADPIHPSLTPTSPTPDPSNLPHCPSCRTGLLRPGVVWFGETLPEDTLSEISTYIDAGPIDLIMVIGTTAKVWPAAGYVDIARQRGARVAVVNVEGEDLGAAEGLGEGDFLFVGDAAVVLPGLLGAGE